MVLTLDVFRRVSLPLHTHHTARQGVCAALLRHMPTELQTGKAGRFPGLMQHNALTQGQEWHEEVESRRVTGRGSQADKGRYGTVLVTLPLP